MLATSTATPPPPTCLGGARYHRVRLASILLGLVLILGANLYIRRHLERTELPSYAVFENNIVPLTWKLLLPYDMGAGSNLVNRPGTYHWFTTGTTIVKFCEQYQPAHRVFYALNALLIVSSFLLSFQMFRSLVFSYTVAICMAFGTQLHWVYICSSLTAFYLYLIFLEANLLCFLKVLATGSRRWQAAFVGSLILLALNHEQWLDYFAFLFLGCLFLAAFAWRTPAPELRPRILFLLASSCALAALYLAIRMSYGQQQYRPGDESEMIFTYGSRLLAAEDLFSNVVTYLYLAFSNFFPPCLVASNSLYHLGADAIVAEQNGYHASHAHLVTMHHLFSWYYLAGIVFALFAYFLYRNARMALQQGSSRHAYLTLWMLLVLTGFAIHALVKYRPYLSVPLLTYKCTTSVVGVTYLLAHYLKDARTWFSRRWLYLSVVALVWGVIAYGALTRPAYLSHLSKQVGMSELPDPLRHLRGR